MATPVDSQAPAVKVSAFTDISSNRKAVNGFAQGLVYACMVLALIPLVWLLWEVVVNGIPVILQPEWWTQSQRGISPINPDQMGGARHAVLGTVIQVTLTSILSIPVGIFVGIYLVEYAGTSRLGKITTFMVDILSGVPSIVAALFIYSVWIVLFGFDKSGFAVSLALVLLMIPVIVRNTEEMLRVVPQDLREASYALGVPKWKTIARIVLPTALSGIVTGVMLAIARVMGESAPVLILVGSTPIVNSDPFNGPQSSLPLMMLDMYKKGAVGADEARMWGAALTLVLIIAVLNILARWVSKRFSPKAV